MRYLLFSGSLAFALGLAAACTMAKAENPAPANTGQSIWTVLASEGDHSIEGPIVFEAWDYRLTEREYDIGLTHFLNGREATPELEDAWRARLEEQFLTLRWLEDTRQAEDVEFRLRARLALKEELASLVLNGTLAGLRITDEDVREYYEQNRARFEQPAMVEVRMILVPTAEEAEEVLEKLAAGETFSSLAAAHSKHESAAQFGQLPPFARGTYNRSFEEKAFEMQPGTTGHVATGAGVFIIRKVANIPPVVTPFEQVRPGLRAELERQRRAAFRADQLEVMRADLEQAEPAE